MAYDLSNPLAWINLVEMHRHDSPDKGNTMRYARPYMQLAADHGAIEIMTNSHPVRKWKHMYILAHSRFQGGKREA